MLLLVTNLTNLNVWVFLQAPQWGHTILIEIEHLDQSSKKTNDLKD